MELLEIQLLGRFGVVVDGRPVPEQAWSRRAAELVKVLALAPGHALHRERVVEAIWPDLRPDAGFANLHKAAHLARRASGDAGAVVLRHGQVLLAPDARVETDVDRFEASCDPGLYTGDLLPDDRYESWTLEPRERLERLYREALRARGRWVELAAEDPADEEAHCVLMSAELEAGDRRAALQRFHRLRDALAAAGLSPGAETLAVHEEIARGPVALAPLAATGGLVGREREVEVMRAAWRRAADGRGSAIVVSGEAGVGKTRLAEALLHDAEGAGWTTLRGGGHEAEGSEPYAPVVEALDGLLASRPDLPGRLGDAARSELARLSVVLPGETPEPGGGSGRKRLFTAVGQLLAAAAREHGAVLLVEDVHAADEASLELLHALARMARFQRLLVLLTARSERPRAAVERLRASLLEQRLGETVALEPLDRDAARSLAERVAGVPLDDEAVGAIWRLAGGNPFFTEELATAVRRDGTVDVPHRLYEILRARLGRLDAASRDALVRVAIVGTTFSLAELQALSGLDEDAAFATLDDAFQTGIVDAEGPAYRFRHGLVREALVHGLTPHRRAATHREAAERLAAVGGPPGRVAFHLLEGGLAAEAVPFLERAARQAQDLAAYADALRDVETALRHADDAGRPALLSLRADLLLATGDPRAGTAYAEAIGAGVRATAAVRAKQARAYLAAGDVPAATAALDGARARTTADRARLLVTGGVVAWFRGDLEAAEHGLEEGRPLAIAAGLAQETTEATQLRACLDHTRGQWGRRVQHDLVETLRHPELSATVFDAHVCVAEWVLTSGEPFEQLEAAAGELGAAAERSGARRAQAFAETVLGEAGLFTGRLVPAGQHLRAAVALSREVGTLAGESLACVRLAETRLAGGEEDRGLLDEAFEAARSSTLPDHLLYLVFAAKIRSAADPFEALALVDEAEGLLDVRPRCAYCPMELWVAAADACARAGAVERAGAYLGAAEASLPLWPGGPWPAAVAEARASLALSQGANGDALRLLGAAVEGFRRAGRPLAERRAREAARKVSGRPAS
ncbi:ATP-binding protein [Gaiella sp.]|uniref:ATP-binding protein n=1 Tax=Gaiella sp. TaxID=2663207 RepID=UPI002E349D37|nr:AAA family ATPase [Gaiella sp.]HEX5584046.1 AAA family ATPase [Gaiella sp.]